MYLSNGYTILEALKFGGHLYDNVYFIYIKKWCVLQLHKSLSIFVHKECKHILAEYNLKDRFGAIQKILLCFIN